MEEETDKHAAPFALLFVWISPQWLLVPTWAVTMALLFFGGVMNLYWIVGLAVFVLLEKIIPLGHWLGRLAGVVLI